MLLQQLDHLAFRVTDFKSVVDYYVRQMGFAVVQEMEMEFGKSRAISRVLNLPGTQFFIFVDQGLDEENIITQWVRKYGSGLHHQAFLVADIESVFTQLRQRGVQFTTDKIIDTGGGLKQLFTLPNPITNVLTEIIQRDRPDVFFVKGNVIQLIQSTHNL